MNGEASCADEKGSASSSCPVEREHTAGSKCRGKVTSREANATISVRAGAALGYGGSAGGGETWKRWYESCRFYC